MTFYAFSKIIKQTKFGNTAQNAPNLAPNNDKFVNLKLFHNIILFEWLIY